MTKLVITGFMGSGKSSVARALADFLKCEAIDLDSTIESEQARSIREIIESDGESRFRELEHLALNQVIQRSGNFVLALGGGTWIAKPNRELIQQHNITSVWLNAPFALCWKRIAQSNEARPLARNESAAFELFKERTACYELANLRVAVKEEQSAAAVATEIVNALVKISTQFGKR